MRLIIVCLLHIFFRISTSLLNVLWGAIFSSTFIIYLSWNTILFICLIMVISLIVIDMVLIILIVFILDYIVLIRGSYEVSIYYYDFLLSFFLFLIIICIFFAFILYSLLLSFWMKCDSGYLEFLKVFDMYISP